ncbi:hypothetical protein BOX15_Mlig022285g1 [Macrostomum lignano]|uniref:Fucolectin tachylectin-4 pentraxin-1 domain-containing protein n=1 Tax=Macrostomum lignano TaxID=282301 RepID=A0A267GP45_9PLAT|nr:hypothetical protein BOX15_Mlig022285g1 [Macrostomum lignano]
MTMSSKMILSLLLAALVFNRATQPADGAVYQQIQLFECKQSSTHNDAKCVRAIDGNTNQDYHAGSCTHTATPQSWWQARAERLTHFKQIRIYNRMDCCSERLDYFSIYIDGHLSAAYRGEPFSHNTFNVDRVGEVLRIQSHRDSAFSLCEVQVFGEVVSLPAIGERLAFDSCSQSSTSAEGVCDRAIDGSTKQDYSYKSCSHTNQERGWWQGHLTKTSEVTHVRIYNRLDCCSERLSDFAVLIDGHECASYRSEPSSFFSVLTLPCEGAGQTIKIVNRRPTSLTLCEVQAFGKVKEDISLPSKQLRFNSCSQSSTTSGGDCKRAFDGIRKQDYHAGSCTHTESAHNNWWQGQMRQAAFVTQVRIYNRLDCCSDRLNDFSISVGGHECASYRSDGYFSARTFECHAYGQVVRIDSHKAVPLTLCEVEVFGSDQPRK